MDPVTVPHRVGMGVDEAGYDGHATDVDNFVEQRRRISSLNDIVVTEVDDRTISKYII